MKLVLAFLPARFILLFLPSKKERERKGPFKTVMSLVTQLLEMLACMVMLVTKLILSLSLSLSLFAIEKPSSLETLATLD